MINNRAIGRKFGLRFLWGAWAVGLALFAGQTAAFAQAPAQASAQVPADPVTAERARLREDVDRLEAQLRAIKDRLQALEPASPAPSAAAASSPAPAPPVVQTAAAPTEPVEFESRTGPISGYMDFHFNKPEGDAGVLDFHRFVLLFNHSFTDRLRFVGELELEHSLVEGLEEAGELELEQAYIDFLLAPKINL